MLYIVLALKAEAQAFVDKYKLSKSKIGDFVLYSNLEIRVLISGIGVLNAKIATQKLIEYYQPKKSDIFLNIGICGANRNYNIGELIEIGTIIYHNKKFTINQDIPTTINCIDKETDEDKYEIVDMESYGFYEAAKDIDNIYMYKVVSDHFEPIKVTKEGAKALIFNVIEELMQKVNYAKQ